MSQTPHEALVEFHEAFGLPVLESPQWPSKARVELRWDLIHEEYLEVAESIDNTDLSNFAKELADLVYVCYGAAVEHGINLDKVFAEVHRSNMSKLMPDGTVRRRADGKVLKGPDYQEPDIQGTFVV